jgi:hypothetical protein
MDRAINRGEFPDNIEVKDIYYIVGRKSLVI